MNLLLQLQTLSARALDLVKNVALQAGAETRISIIVSHPGTVEDSFIVGEHDTAELFAILTRMETGARTECDVTATGIGPIELKKGGAVQ